MFERTRRKYALKFGKLEHKSARLLGITIIITLIAIYFKIKQEYIIYLALINLFLWVVYLMSHKVEKKLYPNNFR